MWVVVEFIKEKSVSVVPECWLMQNKNACCWPPTPKVSHYVVKCIKPSGSWQIFGVRLLGSGKVYDNYLKARAAARLGERTSDIDLSHSESEKRIRKPNKRYSERFSDGTSSDNDVSEDDDAAGYPCFPKETSENTYIPNNSKIAVAAVATAKDSSSPGETNGTALKDWHESSNLSTPRKCVNVGASTSNRIDNTPTKEPEITANVSDDLLQRFIRNQSSMHIKLANIQTDVSNIVDFLLKNKSFIGNNEQFEYNDDLPVKTIEEFKELDKFLNNGDNFRKFVTYVQKTGGMSPYECVKRVCSKLITDNVATNISWNGTKSKLAMANLNIQKGITTGIMANEGSKRYTEKDIENAVKSWLRHAKSRTKK